MLGAVLTLTLAIPALCRHLGIRVVHLSIVRCDFLKLERADSDCRPVRIFGIVH